jgi:diguanylate cyclase (GGDEF)-like protein
MRSALEAAHPEGPKASDIFVEQLKYTDERLDEMCKQAMDAAKTGSDKRLQFGATLDLMLDALKPPLPEGIEIIEDGIWHGYYKDPETGEYTMPDVAKYKMLDPLDIVLRLQLGTQSMTREVAASLVEISEKKNKKFAAQIDELEQAIERSKGNLEAQKAAQEKLKKQIADVKLAEKIARQQSARADPLYSRLECAFLANRLKVMHFRSLLSVRLLSFPPSLYCFTFHRLPVVSHHLLPFPILLLLLLLLLLLPPPETESSYFPTTTQMEEDFKEAKERCEKKGHRTLLLSVDVQGLKAVNDNTEHAKGTEVLTEYGEALVEAAKKTKEAFEKKGVDAFTRAYHIGGDEFAFMVVAPEASLSNELAKNITKSVADIKPIVKVTTKAEEIPTMLRVGACVGVDEGETMMNVADEAETAVRCAVYVMAFGSMDARGAYISKDHEKLKGTPNWRVQMFDAKIAAERSKAVEEAKAAAEEGSGARGLATSKKLEALNFMYIGGLSDKAVKDARDKADEESEAKKSGNDKISKMEAEIKDLKRKLAVFEAKKEQKKSQRSSSRLSSRPQSRPKPSLSSDSRASSVSRAQQRSKVAAPPSRRPTPSKKTGGGRK